jgi:hypothetical protein
MSYPAKFPLSGRYWTITLLLPFAAFILAMVAYAVVHGYFGVPEPDVGGDASEFLAAIFEALTWMVAILALEYAALLRLYPLDLRSMFSWGPLNAVDSVLGGTPAMLAGGAGFVLALMLGRALVGDDVFAGDTWSVFALFALLNGPIIAPRIDLGEERRHAADEPVKGDIA